MIRIMKERTSYGGGLHAARTRYKKKASSSGPAVTPANIHASSAFRATPYKPIVYDLQWLSSGREQRISSLLFPREQIGLLHLLLARGLGPHIRIGRHEAFLAEDIRIPGVV